MELYRQANRAERVARVSAAKATGDVLCGVGLALSVAGGVATFAGLYYEWDRTRKTRRVG